MKIQPITHLQQWPKYISISFLDLLVSRDTNPRRSWDGDMLGTIVRVILKIARDCKIDLMPAGLALTSWSLSLSYLISRQMSDLLSALEDFQIFQAAFVLLGIAVPMPWCHGKRMQCRMRRMRRAEGSGQGQGLHHELTQFTDVHSVLLIYHTQTSWNHQILVYKRYLKRYQKIWNDI